MINWVITDSKSRQILVHLRNEPDNTKHLVHQQLSMKYTHGFFSHVLCLYFKILSELFQDNSFISNTIA